MRVKIREGGLIDVSGNLLNKLLPGNSNVRSIGSTILGFAYLAAGRHSGIIYSGVNKYKALFGRLSARKRWKANGRQRANHCWRYKTIAKVIYVYLQFDKRKTRHSATC